MPERKDSGACCFGGGLPNRGELSSGGSSGSLIWRPSAAFSPPEIVATGIPVSASGYRGPLFAAPVVPSGIIGTTIATGCVPSGVLASAAEPACKCTDPLLCGYPSGCCPSVVSAQFRFMEWNSRLEQYLPVAAARSQGQFVPPRSAGDELMLYFPFRYEANLRIPKDCLEQPRGGVCPGCFWCFIQFCQADVYTLWYDRKTCDHMCTHSHFGWVLDKRPGSTKAAFGEELFTRPVGTEDSRMMQMFPKEKRISDAPGVVLTPSGSRWFVISYFGTWDFEIHVASHCPMCQDQWCIWYSHHVLRWRILYDIRLPGWSRICQSGHPPGVTDYENRSLAFVVSNPVPQPRCELLDLRALCRFPGCTEMADRSKEVVVCGNTPGSQFEVFDIYNGVWQVVPGVGRDTVYI